ncbi:MAG TPA: hypothetical protein VHY84_27565 [Bryobacteraceae bacterium]|jgi:hypothetical protein|nr:hypothetical protein [Bryobacteraceae bacterium]
MKLMNISLIIAIFITAASAEQGYTISFGPLPSVVAGSPVPLDSTQFVFVGPNISQLTISYPSVLAGTPSADRISFVVGKLDQVKPAVSSSVTDGPAGAYTYTYAIHNDLSATDGIQVWSLSLPASDAATSASHPSWNTTMEVGSPSTVLPPAGMVGLTPVLFASWHAPANGAVRPNSTVSGFQIVSHYRPGLTFVYARSAEDYAVPATLPAPVSSQLDVMRQRDWMNKRITGIGPRFPDDWTRDVVAADFRDGIARLIVAGELDASSNFVTMLNTSLDTIISSQGAPIPLASVIAVAGSQLEKNIANAISLSLQ